MVDTKLQQDNHKPRLQISAFTRLLTLLMTNSQICLALRQSNFTILVNFIYYVWKKTIRQRAARRLIALRSKQNIKGELKWQTCSLMALRVKIFMGDAKLQQRQTQTEATNLYIPSETIFIKRTKITKLVSFYGALKCCCSSVLGLT